MRYLITGGCGFLGSNLSAEVLRRGEELCVVDNLFRHGATSNLDWLRSKGDFLFSSIDIRNEKLLTNVISEFCPERVFHLAGQVAMTTSIQNPRLDFEINVIGSLNLLESIRIINPMVPVIFSSTNKVYGDLEYYGYREDSTRYTCPSAPQGFNELLPLDFHSPYGCSKGSADQYMLDYHRIFGLKTIVFRHSSIFGGRQYSSEDQGWIGWFMRQALEKKRNPNCKPFAISGNGKQVRDVLYIDDLINCYFAAMENIQVCQGHAFNIGGGIRNSLSLIELFQWLECKLNININFSQLPWRCSDQRFFVANAEKANAFFNWKPKIEKDEGLEQMLNWMVRDGCEFI